MEGFALKRSNSQTEFDFLPYNQINHQSNENNNVIEIGNMSNPFASGGNNGNEDFIDNVHLERSFSVPAFVNPMQQLNNFIKYQYRNSFDFLELESQNLLELTGDKYNTMISNQQVLLSHYQQQFSAMTGLQQFSMQTCMPPPASVPIM